MEVTHVRDHVTHAVIGGRQAIDATISDSAEFFHILSSTLYTDQYLAVVREVLCNAWDAHIEAGCTDKPVQVTITDEAIVVRDFGKGIHDDLIGAIYLTYGGSTKKGDGRQTGGFGLGCKSPWAYTEHFEVVSHHAGRRTLYNMSKSSAEVAGKPAAIPIASFPSDETGLQVAIPLKTRHDNHRFANLFRRIAANGEMNVVLNGEQLKVLPFSTMKHNFIMTGDPVIESHQRINLRYGHVIYPVESCEEIAEDYSRIVRFLDGVKLEGNYGVRIVFQAPPHSITVTPSREALSMQEHTITTLKGILAGFVKLLDSQMQSESFKAAEEAVRLAWTSNQPDKLLSPERKLHIPLSTGREAKWLDDLGRAIHMYARYSYPTYKGFRFKDLMLRLDSLIKSATFDVDLLKSYRSEIIRTNRRSRKGDRSTWLHRKVLAPLITDMKAERINPAKLMVHFTSLGRSGRYWDNPPLPEALKFPRRGIEELMPFTRNIVVLAYSRTDVYDRAENGRVGKALELDAGCLVYLVPRNSNKIEKIRQFFRDRSAELIDLTVVKLSDGKTAPAPVKFRDPPKPRLKGYPLLSGLVNSTGEVVMNRLDNIDPATAPARTETPELVVKHSSRESTHLAGFTHQSTLDISRLWGDRIAIAVNSPQYDKMIQAGAKDLTTFVVEQVVAEFTNNKRLRAFMAFDANRMDDSYPKHRVVPQTSRFIYQDELLRKKFGIVDKRTPEDKMFFRLWEELTLNQYGLRSDYKDLAAMFEEISAIPTHENVVKLCKLIRTSTLLECLEISELRNIARSEDPAKEKLAQTARQILILALQG